jgi:hypothetical protein
MRSFVFIPLIFLKEIRKPRFTVKEIKRENTLKNAHFENRLFSTSKQVVLKLKRGCFDLQKGLFCF